MKHISVNVTPDNKFTLIHDGWTVIDQFDADVITIDTPFGNDEHYGSGYDPEHDPRLTDGSEEISAENLIQYGSFQTRARQWACEAFGQTVSDDLLERSNRFVEEALELAQSLDMSREDAHALVDYVYNRPVGETKQEIGGVMMTLAVLCGAIPADMNEAAETELARVWKKIEQIRAKQANKPKGPLPE